MDKKIPVGILIVLVVIAAIFHIVAVSTNHWVKIEPYYEDFLWKGCYKKGFEIGCDRLPDYNGGAAMVALRSVAVNYSKVGVKPYDLVYSGIWRACLDVEGQSNCEDLLTGQGQRINTDWIRTVRAFMVMLCVSYILLILPPLIFRSKFPTMMKVLGFAIILPFILGVVGLFVFSGWSGVNLRHKNYYGWSYFLACFGSFFLYISIIMSFLLGFQSAPKKTFM